MTIIGGAPTGPGAKKPGLKDKWQSMAPKTRQRVALFGVLGGIALVAFILLSATGNSGPRVATETKDGKVVNSLLPDENTREIGMTGLAKDTELNREEQQKVTERVKRLEDVIAQKAQDEARGGGQRGQSAQVLETVNKQAEEIAELRALIANGGGAQNAQAAAGEVQVEEVGPTGYGGIKVIRETKAEGTGSTPGVDSAGGSSGTDSGVSAGSSSGGVTKPSVNSMYMPSGAMVTGVLITGLDAPTGRGALKDPVPVLVRVKKDAILPNRYKADVKECFILAAGSGDLPSERAYLRSETMSCVRHDKSVIDIKIQAYAVDTDGKAGLRGRLVSKQGAVLGKAIIASFAEGVSQAFSGNNRVSMNGGDVDYSGGMQSGAIGGASSALDRVAKYYLDLADSLHPVLEIDAGRPITLVFVKGQEMPTVK